jgi:hypothetical protein
MKMFALLLVLVASASVLARESDLDPANYPLKAHVTSTDRQSAGAMAVPTGSIVTAVPVMRRVAEIRLSDGKTYVVHGGDVRNLQVGEDYPARITEKKHSRLEILGTDDKGRLQRWSVIIQGVHE